MEDPFATSRNGHALHNMYNPANQTLDIHSKGLYPSNVLSNLYGHRFKIDGVWCESMEGFLQSLKYRDEDTQRQICALKGGSAKGKSTDTWQRSQVLWWRGIPYQRERDDFGALIYRAYKAMSQYSPTFRYALLATDGLRLTHSIGEQDISKTILTEGEFCGFLQAVRYHVKLETRRYQRTLIVVGLLFALMAIFALCQLFVMSTLHAGRLVFFLVSFSLAVLSFYLVYSQRRKINRLKSLARRPS